MLDLDMVILKGNVGVLLSSPHSAQYRRPDIERRYKSTEINTEKIVLGVHYSVDTFGLYLKTKVDYDPNFVGHGRNEYKKKLRRLILDAKSVIPGGIKLFIDIHGLHDSKEYDFEIITLKRSRKASDIAQELMDELRGASFAGSSVVYTYADEENRETLIQFVQNEFKIPSMQIEVARYIREDPELLEEFIRALSNFSLKFN